MTRKYVPSNRVSDDLLTDLIDFFECSLIGGMDKPAIRKAGDLIAELKSVRYKRITGDGISSKVRGKMNSMDRTPLQKMKRVIKNRRKKGGDKNGTPG